MKNALLILFSGVLINFALYIILEKREPGYEIDEFICYGALFVIFILSFFDGNGLSVLFSGCFLATGISLGIQHTPIVKPVVKEKEYIEIEIPIDTVTVYNASVEQCDSEPNVTASKDTIDFARFPEDWIAVSRELLKEYNPKALMSMKDTVWLETGDTVLGFFTIRDVCNKRFKNRVDLLCKSRKLGRWTKCKIIIYQ